jgi:hypothetical protein
VSEELCIRHHDKFDWSWAARAFLQDDELKMYWELRCCAQEQYDDVMKTMQAEGASIRAAAWAKSDQTCAAAQAECDQTCAAAQAECDRICDSAQAECASIRADRWIDEEKMYNTARDAYTRTCAAAFGRLAEQQGDAVTEGEA